MKVQSAPGDQKPICVVVDTCVWRAEPLLKTPMGLTLVYNISRRGGLVGLPEVVELEIKKQIIEAGLEAIDKAKGPLQMLDTIMDNPFLIVNFPTAEELSQKVNDRLSELASILVREPFTVDQAKAALAMVNAKLPPNGENNQQFKDSAIWQAVLSLSQRYSAILLTNDKAFFRDRDPAKGLAKNLLGDCAAARITVAGYYGIRPYLESLKADEPQFDRERVKSLVIALAVPRLKGEAERWGIAPTEMLDAGIFAFATGKPDQLAIDYTLAFKLESNPPDTRLDQNHKGIVHGSGYYLPNEGALTDHYIQRIAIKNYGSHYARAFRDYDNSFAFPRPIPWE